MGKWQEAGIEREQNCHCFLNATILQDVKTDNEVNLTEATQLREVYVDRTGREKAGHVGRMP